MDVVQKIQSALDGIVVAFFDTPEFAENNVPEKYVIVNIAEKGGNYSESVNRCTEYFISLNVYTDYLDFSLYNAIKRAMSGAEFSYIGGGKVDDDKISPYNTHYYLDFAEVTDN